MNQKEFKKYTLEIEKLEQKQREYIGYDTNISTMIREIKNKMESIFDVVNVSYMIGSREYCEKAFKIGKSYFDYNNFNKMTRSRGVAALEEIPTITQAMKDEMIADSYYY